MRLKYAMSPFFAASTKLFSAAINDCSKGLSGFSGAFAFCALMLHGRNKHARNEHTRHVTKPFFIRTLHRDFICVTNCAQLLCCHSRQSIHTPSVLLQPVNLQAFRSSFAAPGWQIPSFLLELEKRHAVAAGVTDAIDLDDNDRARSFIDWKMRLQTRELCLVHFDGPSLSMQS